MIKSFFILIFSLYFFFLGGISSAQEGQNTQDRKKRDPFIALVDSNGKIKSGDDLFPVIQKKPLSMNIILSAIIWDEKRPLAMINNKVYAEGSDVVSGLKLEKINPSSIVLNDNGNEVTVQLRKNIKNE